MNKKQTSKAASDLGKLGGIARAMSLSPERRKEIATKASRARWPEQKDETNTRDIETAETC